MSNHKWLNNDQPRKCEERVPGAPRGARHNTCDAAPNTGSALGHFSPVGPAWWRGRGADHNGPATCRQVLVKHCHDHDNISKPQTECKQMRTTTDRANRNKYANGKHGIRTKRENYTVTQTARTAEPSEAQRNKENNNRTVTTCYTTNENKRKENKTKQKRKQWKVWQTGTTTKHTPTGNTK